jgi:uncharacterized protein (TIGR00730 family)
MINIDGENSRISKADAELLQSHKKCTEETVQDVWQIMKIQAELVNGFETLKAIEPAISILGTARTKEDHPYYKKCVELAKLLAENGFNIITGGGGGIMEAGNRGAQEGKAKGIGLNIKLPREQEPNRYQDVSVNFDYFFVRKLMFSKFSFMHVFMPGGFGTMDELFTVLCLIQTKKMQRVPLVLYGTEFWCGMISWIKDTMLKEGYLNDKEMDLLRITDDPHEVLQIAKEIFETLPES